MLGAVDGFLTDVGNTDDQVFGDLFLEDIRAYREERRAEAGMTAIFPLWGRDTASLARAMLDAGLVAHVTCVDPSRIDEKWLGRPFDEEFLDALPEGVDPCGENGEFRAVDVRVGGPVQVPLAQTRYK